MEWFNKIIDTFISPKLKVSQKFAIFVLVILFFTVVDNIIGFSYNYEVDNKIQQIERLDKIINSSNTDSIGKKYAIEIRRDIYQRRNFVQSIFYHIKSIEWRRANIEKKNDDNAKILLTKSNLWFHLTAGGLWYILGFLIFPIINIFSGNETIPQRISATILGAVCITLIALLLYFICSLVPIISNDTLVYNYIINILIQIGSFVLLIYITNKFRHKWY